MGRTRALSLAGLGLAAALASSARAEPRIEPARISDHVRVLASDEYEGRRPGSRGGEKAVAYIVEAFRKAGLEPAAADGGWLQPVTTETMMLAGPVSATWAGEGSVRPLASQDLAITPGLALEAVKVEGAPLIFLGHGVHRPHLGWDDFKGADITGKIAVILPGAAPAGPIAGDVDRFETNESKYAELARRGAVGVLTLEDPTLGWAEHQAQAARPLTRLVLEPGDPPTSPRLTGVLRRKTAQEMLTAGGVELSDLLAQAERADFKPQDLPVRLSADYRVSIRRVTSPNVIGKIAGTRAPQEAIIFHAHWDHLGRTSEGPHRNHRFKPSTISPARPGDDIFNGALDNAVGVGAIIEIAGQLSGRPRPGRTILFLATTEEEAHHLGAQHYLRHPVSPLATTVADLNVDVSILRGPTREVSVFGLGKTDLESLLADAAGRRGLYLRAATEEGGLYRRSEHYDFARHGIPVLFANAGVTPTENSPAVQANLAWASTYMAERYHHVTDEWSPQMDFRGTAQHAEMFAEVGWRLATTRIWPAWRPGVDFGVVRERTREARR